MLIQMLVTIHLESQVLCQREDIPQITHQGICWKQFSSLIKLRANTAVVSRKQWEP